MSLRALKFFILGKVLALYQFLMGESYLLYNCHGNENPYHLFENIRLITLERGERPVANCSV